MSTSTDDVVDKVKTAMEDQEFAVGYNLQKVFGGLMFSLKQEMERKGHVGVFDMIIRTIQQTSRYAGPEHEQYPVWDANKLQPELKVLQEVLEAHGIKGVWHNRRTIGQ